MNSSPSQIHGANLGVINRVSNLSALFLLGLMFIGILSFSIRNYITHRMIFDIYSDRFFEFEEEEAKTEVRIKKGDSLKKVLVEQNTSQKDIASILSAIKAAKIDIKLKPSDTIAFDHVISDIEDNTPDQYNDTANAYLKKITITSGSTRSIIITKNNESFVAEEVKTKLIKKYAYKTIYIESALAPSMLKYGIGRQNVHDIINAYSCKVDFQRQIQPRDFIKVLIEQFYNEDGQFLHNGKVIFSSLNLRGQDHNIYLFKNNKPGSHEYYSETGQSVKRSLLRTPISSSRISSKFGKRQDPLHGFTKMHKGVDFSAPTGTPILASGDGIVKEMGYRGAYGNIIKIKHNSSITTAYAHASKFASNLKIGSRVKQGQIIAYVGKTGRATGPHCHFEVIINGKHVNPLSMQTTPGAALKNKDLTLFEKQKSQIKQLLSTIHTTSSAVEFSSLENFYTEK